ncbi:MrpH family fimbial adhesin [Pantoea trifolii]|uniref:MrpH family fimbial adhesin n=1 Tax=Candidatus Pantoea symbiotica TaxID=1884370 RepID=UPI002412E9C6|nr:hypothetical protein [Pantoea rodasii]
MNIRSLLSPFFIFWLSAAIAGPFPVPLSITRTDDRPFARLKVVWTTIDFPFADAQAPANYWFGSSSSTGLDFKVVQSETCVNDICGSKVIPGETISATAMRAFKKGPSTTYYPAGGGQNGVCVAFGGIPQGNTSYATAMLPTGCLKTQPPNVYCFIVTPEINLNHGSISIKDVTTSTASTSASISCSQKNNAKLSLASKLTYVPLNNDAKANILINNKKPNETHSLEAGLSSLTITSQLEGITQGGIYSGTAVLIVEPV